MSAIATAWVRGSTHGFRTWLVSTIVICVLAGITLGWFFAAYAALVLATAAVLRQVSREPGSWLGRRGVRRSLVALLGADCLALALSGLWLLTSAMPVLLFILLILFNIALGRATHWLATAPDAILDERQEALRNRAHVVSYRLLTAVLTLTIVIGVATPQTRSWLTHILITGFVGYLQLLFALPAMVLAWIEPDRLAPESEHKVRDVWAAVSLPLLGLTIATPFLLSLILTVLPVHTTASMSPRVDYVGSPGARSAVQCHEFMARTTVGAGVQAEIPLHASACWDGRHAFEAWGMNHSDCEPAGAMLTTVTTASCTRTTAADGTLHFTYRAAVRPALLPFLVREVEVSVVLDRNGHVEQFP